MKLLDLVATDGRRVRRFRYTSIDDASKIRSLKICPSENQRTARASSTMRSSGSLSVCGRSGPTPGTSFMPKFTRTSRTSGSSTSTSMRGHNGLAARSNAPTKPTR
jgi:hypothetical protein